MGTRSIGFWPFWPVTASQNAALTSRVRWLPVVDSGSSIRSITVIAFACFSASTICTAGNGRKQYTLRQPGLDSLFLPQPIDRGLGRFHVATHADQNVLGIVTSVRHHEVVSSPRGSEEFLECFLQRRLHLVVIPALGQLAFHVRILILHDARHHRVGRVHQVHELLFGLADEHSHQLRFNQTHAFHRVRGEKAILHIEERSGRRFGRPASDQTQVARFLRVPGEQHAPTAIGDAHHIIVASVHVEPLARERPGTNVEHCRQPLAGDRVQHFFHEYEALTGSEIGHPAARRREPFTKRCRRMFALRLDEHELVAPQIGHAVHNGLVEPATHRRGAGDRKCTAALRNVRLHPHHRLGTIARGGDSRVLIFLNNPFYERNIGRRPINRLGSHRLLP